MASYWSDLVLSSVWAPATAEHPAVYTLQLHNPGQLELTGFTLGFSGPARISDEASLVGGQVLRQLSNYCEIAPPADFVLGPGSTWTVEIAQLDHPIRHWTDGAVTGFVIDGENRAHAIRTLPSTLAGSDAERKRGRAQYPIPETPLSPIAIVPWPAEVAVDGRLTAPTGLSITAAGILASAARDAFTSLVHRLFPGEGLVCPEHAGGYPVTLKQDALGAEGYRLNFTPDGTTLSAETHAGFFYGLVTLAQILRGARFSLGRFAFPASGTIIDSPAMVWRGCHLDVARRFYTRDEIEQFLAVMAWNKLNVFHWHLSDDEAWRVEIDAYPDLVHQSAWRGHGLPIPPLLGSGPERSGGYYTKDDIRAVVSLAGSYGIDIVPEIDMPGHCHAMLTALPQLRDPGENGLYQSIQSFPNNCLNPGVEAVYATVETILAELLDLFPSRYFHIGADEVPADAWESSPLAQALSRQLGEDGAAPLQAHFLRRLQAFLTRHGRVTGAWEEASHGGGIAQADCYLVGWRDLAASRALATAGYRVVVAPGQAYYFDMALSGDWHECGAAWAGASSLEQTYSLDPVAGWTDSEREMLLGVQACIWSEPMTDRAVFDRLVFPRLSALAEAGWSRARNFDRFIGMVGLMPSLYGLEEQP